MGQLFQDQEEESSDSFEFKPDLKDFRRFKITGDHFLVTEQIIKNNTPLIQEFDFNMEENPNKLDIDLKQSVKLRFY